MLQSLMRDRRRDPGRTARMDVRFDDFMADDLAIAEQVYELAGEELTDEAGAAMKEYLDGHQRGRLGHGRDERRDVRAGPRRAARPLRAVRRALPVLRPR